ncbi:energy transducer TonB [Bernardetia sp. OM2101]|uniref:energy transducer TonB n=1 Tax=Bernardetia sp. OM2101 TaxID=3344876 RepID=UPI0035D0F4AA
MKSNFLCASVLFLAFFISTGFIFSTPSSSDFGKNSPFQTNFVLQDTSKKRHEVTLLDVPPSFEGGMSKFHEYVDSNLVYPESARKRGVEGFVSLEFIVNKDGHLTNIEVVKSLDKECDEEAIRLLRESPKWIPGFHEGRIVKVRMTYPIVFKLNDKEDESEYEEVIIDY